MKPRAWFKTLRFRISAIAALCWLLPTLVLGIYLGNVFFGALREKTEAALVSGAEHARTLTAAEVQRAITLSKDATYDGTLEQSLSAYRGGFLKYEDYYRQCRSFLEQKYSREPAFTFSAFFRVDEPEQLIFTRHDADRALAFQRSHQERVLALGEALDTDCGFYAFDGAYYLVRNLYNRRMERFGMLVFGIDPHELLAPLLREGEALGGWVDVALGDWALNGGAGAGEPLNALDLRPGLYSKDGALCYEGRHRGRDFVLSYRIGVDERTAYSQSDAYHRLMALLLLLLLPIEGLIMLFIDRRMTRPIQTLAAAARRMEGGELGVTVPADCADEIGQLEMAYNDMSLRIKELIERSYQEEIALRDARIEALQSRINPHFLNNSLEIINWQARMEGSLAISSMIESLSTLINASLDRSNRRVAPLREEIEVAKAYFFFLRQRFGERLSSEWDVNEAFLDVEVPRLILQPLLENAVEHGIAPAGRGCIRLAVCSGDMNLYLEVANDGRRLNDRDFQRIEALLREGESTPSECVGIRNVHRRLRLIYGERAGLSVLRDARGDTRFRIQIPLDVKPR